MSLYKKTEQFVIKTFTKKHDGIGIKHFLRTVYWIKQLKPNADEALLIAAIAHDLERGYRNAASYNKITKSKKGFRSKAHLIHHQEEGARRIAEFLVKQNAAKKLITRVKMLVSKHEIGGNNDQNLLKDADSLSFFENNVGKFIKKAKEKGKQKIKDKFNWMFNRLTSKKARQIARPWYKAALNKLRTVN